jgi:hypothetical protein
MSAIHYLHTAARLPPHMSPVTVIAALHDHTTALTLQALTSGHDKLPENDPTTLKDTYWYPVDLNPLVSYAVTEVITILPWFAWAKKHLTFPVVFQDTKEGIKTRADASGVVVRAEFRVMQGGAAAEVEGEGQGVGDAEWVLVEDVEVSCAWWMMPFVKGKMEEAHMGICGKVIEKVEMERRSQDVAATSNSPMGMGRMDKDKELPVLPLAGGTRGAVEIDAMDTQKMELPAADVPEKISYR